MIEEIYYRAKQNHYETLFDVNGQKWDEAEVFNTRADANALYPNSEIEMFTDDDIPNREYIDVGQKTITIYFRK